MRKGRRHFLLSISTLRAGRFGVRLTLPPPFLHASDWLAKSTCRHTQSDWNCQTGAWHLNLRLEWRASPRHCSRQHSPPPNPLPTIRSPKPPPPPPPPIRSPKAPPPPLPPPTAPHTPSSPSKMSSLGGSGSLVARWACAEHAHGSDAGCFEQTRLTQRHNVETAPQVPFPCCNFPSLQIHSRGHKFSSATGTCRKRRLAALAAPNRTSVCPSSEARCARAASTRGPATPWWSHGVVREQGLDHGRSLLSFGRGSAGTAPPLTAGGCLAPPRAAPRRPAAGPPPPAPRGPPFPPGLHGRASSHGPTSASLRRGRRTRSRICPLLGARETWQLG